MTIVRTPNIRFSGSLKKKAFLNHFVFHCFKVNNNDTEWHLNSDPVWLSADHYIGLISSILKFDDLCLLGFCDMANSSNFELISSKAVDVFQGKISSISSFPFLERDLERSLVSLSSLRTAFNCLKTSASASFSFWFITIDKGSRPPASLSSWAIHQQILRL
jgi:hypothetical protein